MPGILTLRAARLPDLPHLLELFRETIRVVCARDYTPEQRRVWALGAEDDARWVVKLTNHYFLIAEDEGRMAGFGSLEGSDSIDLLYVHKDYQRRGVARQLLLALEEEARRKGTREIISDVSITARPFFERMGFHPIALQTRMLFGVEISNYRMKKVLKR